ncbi:MAG: efflux RND transporter permease subunit [Spirochaetales bacterium]|jgi:HAE1 family hydrophobic/amphiphilic exporter-1|nr:efflux RND transporter permease subunit [Spirochaetales bacterium]
MKISDFGIKHPSVVLMLMIVLLVFGIMAGLNLRRSLIAEMSMPTLVVFSLWPGAGPEDVEREVTNPLEEALGTLAGLEEMTSSSQDSISLITLQFSYGEKAVDKIPEIREKINSAIPSLPEDLSGVPSIMAYSTDALPVMTILAEGLGSRIELSRYCREELVPRLSRIPGVAQVRLQGASQEKVQIEADLGRLSALGISLLDLAGILSAVNVSLPAGQGVFQDQNLNLRTEGRYESLGEIEDQVIAFREGSYIRLRDLARVSQEEEDRENYVIAGGRDSVAFFITRQSDGDSLSISRDCRRILEEVRQETGGAINFEYLKDDSINIRLSMNSVAASAIMGAVLAVLVLILFLHNISTTLIIGLSIPLSLLFTLAALWAKGSGLDLVTLGGLTAAIGMIVDCSIVVLENIQNHFVMGKDRKTAASLGAQEVGQAVIASTATTLAAFVPLLFLSGLAGIILKDVAWTIIFALFFSAVTAVAVIPFLCARLLKLPKPRSPGAAGAWEGIMEKTAEGYTKMLTAVLDHRRLFLCSALALLVISGLSLRLLGFEFLAQTDMAEIEITLETPDGYTLERTRDKALELERLIREVVPETESSYFVVGQNSPFFAGTTANAAYGMVRLAPRKGRAHVTEIINRMSRELPGRIPGLKGSYKNGGLSNLLSLATGGAAFAINVYGSSLEDVIAASEKLSRIMALDPNVNSVDSNARLNRQELSLKLNPRYMGDLGLSPQAAAYTNRILFNGLAVGNYYGGRDPVSIELTTDLKGGRIPEDLLYRLNLPSAAGEPVSFANFIELESRTAMSSINHRNKSRSITVRAELKDPNVRETSRRVQEELNAQGLVPGVRWEVGGTTAEIMNSFRSLVLVMSIAVFLVYAVMVIQFERFTQPLIIMTSIPFALIGITLGLLAFGATLNIVSLMGIIALAGIVVNNAIVLIDFINLLRLRDGLDLRQAIFRAARSRLKPILMTTITTLLGVIPLALGLGEGSEVYSPLGQSIAGGLLSSTFITLFLVPTLYYIVEDRKERRKALREKGETSNF